MTGFAPPGPRGPWGSMTGFAPPGRLEVFMRSVNPVMPPPLRLRRRKRRAASPLSTLQQARARGPARPPARRATAATGSAPQQQAWDRGAGSSNAAAGVGRHRSPERIKTSKRGGPVTARARGPAPPPARRATAATGSAPQQQAWDRGAGSSNAAAGVGRHRSPERIKTSKRGGPVTAHARGPARKRGTAGDRGPARPPARRTPAATGSAPQQRAWERGAGLKQRSSGRGTSQVTRAHKDF
jgi:hypothetical protein